ncbi:MAG: HNH endonuclease [Acidobacteria bacterium]|nr:HNH endonuclease [Acidobacteriota bacterium]
MREVTLVAGPPCAGKTTHVAAHAQPGDIIVDWNDLAIQAGSPVHYDHAPQYRAAATKRRTELEQHVADMVDGTAWVIRTLPRPAERDAAAYRLGATITVIDPGVQTCLDRARADQRHPDIDAAILRWYGISWGARCYDPTPTLTPTANPRKTHEWRTVRKIVLRGQPPCGICGQAMRYGIPYNRTNPDPLYPTVDHITPVSQGGAWYDPQNLRPAHWRCNSDHKAEPGNTVAVLLEHRVSETW